MLGAFLAAASLTASALSAQTTPTFTNVTVHDPSVIKAGARWYVYGSHGASAWTEDLLHWTQVATSVTSGSPAHFNTFQSELSELIAWTNATTLWAADVIQLGDGRYYYYYNVWTDFQSYRSYMGLAVANGIEGPYADVGEIMRGGTGVAGFNPAIHPNTIDPDAFFDRDGQLWMVYGSYSGGIFILRLDATAGSPTLGRPLPGQGWGTKLIGGNHAQIEGGSIIYSPESQFYYLFVSFGGLAANGGYNIRVLRSANPDGPYFDAAGNNMATTAIPNNQWPTIEPYGVKIMGNCQFQHVTGEPGAANPGYVSPGHNSVYYDPATGQYFLIFHTRFVGRGEIHEVRVHQMFLTSEDWLVPAPHRFAGESLAPIDPVQMPGNYKLINHGKDITTTVKTSSALTLAADGTMSGALTGTWQLVGDSDIVLAQSGVIYRGVVARQWDEDASRWVLGFSALSDNGTAIWGSKVAIDSAPVIVTPPATQTAMKGTSVTLAVAVSADPLPTYQWRRDGIDLEGATDRSLTLSKLTTADAGAYTVQVTNNAGSITSAAALLTVDVPPVISMHPVSVTQAAGTTSSLSVAATGTGVVTYQWFKDDGPIAGATTSTLDFASLAAADAGDYTLQVTDAIATTTSRPARVVVAAPLPGRIANMSVRSTAGRNGQPLIVGFVMAGGSKSVLIRGIGPALAAYDVDGFMPDPWLEMHGNVNNGDAVFATNDDWGDNNAALVLANEFARLGAFPLPDSASKDAAILTAIDGLRSVHANSTAPGESGIVLVEGYDAGDGNSPRLVNISARNFAGQGFETLIAGFIISGNEPKHVLIRGVGPTLADFGVTGVLSDPRLEVHTDIAGVDRTIAANDDWTDEPGVTAMSDAASAFPLRDGSTDAAIVMTLPAGSYTALVSGFGNATGEALVEVYELP